MRELDLYDKVLRGATADGWRLWRIQDGSVGRNPFDLCGVAPGGTALGVEVKLLQESLSERMLRPFPWQKFALHQQNWLREYARKGAYGVALVYSVRDAALTAFLPRPPDFSTLVRAVDVPHVAFRVEGDNFCGWPQLARLARPEEDLG